MGKYKPFIITSLFVVLLAISACFAHTIVTNKTYSYVVENTGSELLYSNISVDTNLDTINYDGPNINNGKVTLDIDMAFNDYFNFSFDVKNTSELEYNLDNIIVNAIGDPEFNNNISFELYYDDGSQVLRNTKILPHTRRRVYGYVKYNKRMNGDKSFKLDIDLDYSPTILK